MTDQATGEDTATNHSTQTLTNLRTEIPRDAKTCVNECANDEVLLHSQRQLMEGIITMHQP